MKPNRDFLNINIEFEFRISELSLFYSFTEYGKKEFLKKFVLAR